jgi:hypothetical protein
VRRSQPNPKPELIRQTLLELINNFGTELHQPDLRQKVIALIPAYHKLRDLGSSLMPKDAGTSAIERIISYFNQYPQTVIAGDEIMVISGIGEWARRVRQLRVQLGWWIYSGITFKQMAQSEDRDAEDLEKLLNVSPKAIKPDQYVLMRTEQDLEAAYRWNLSNQIRRKKASVRDKILEYFRKNVGKQISGEELKYLANNRSEWARRARELRTEYGWPVVTKNSGRTDMPIGAYLLEEDRQAYEHDRKIPDEVRVAVLERDGFKCVICGWSRAMISPDDPRKMLELHHIQHHKDRGENTIDNLKTLCNVHHDECHR